MVGTEPACAVLGFDFPAERNHVMRKCGYAVLFLVSGMGGLFSVVGSSFWYVIFKLCKNLSAVSCIT